MRNYKTSKANRATYRYYDIEGKLRCELVPGQDGVTEVLIQQLHAVDDDEFDASRREAYHIPVHYMAYTSGDAEEAEDRNSYQRTLCEILSVHARPALLVWNGRVQMHRVSARPQGKSIPVPLWLQPHLPIPSGHCKSEGLRRLCESDQRIYVDGRR